MSKKRVAIIALLLTLGVTNVALAVMYLNKDVTISGGVASSGAIAIYQADGQTEMTSIAFDPFQGTQQSATQFFFVNNTGNVPVAVYWRISNCNPDNWAIESGGQAYRYAENDQSKFRFSINNQVFPDGTPGVGLWNPDPTGTEVVTLGVGQGAKFGIDLVHYVEVNTPGTFSFILSFYPKDA